MTPVAVATLIHPHPAEIDAACTQPFQGDFTQRVLAHQRHEADMRAEYGEIMRKDCG